MPQFEKLTLQEFKSFSQAEMTLGRFTVLVGPNASGKTTVLEALHYLTQLPRKAAGEVFSGPRRPVHLRRKSADPSRQTKVSLEWGAEPVGVSFSFEDDGHEGLRAKTESRRGPTTIAGVDQSISKQIGGGVLLHLDPAMLEKPAYSDDEVPRVEFDGEGLPAVLAHLYLADKEAFDRIIDALRSVVSSVRNVRVGREKVPYKPRSFGDAEREIQIQGSALIFDMASGSGIPAHAVSEGTLLTLGLLTVVLGPKERRPQLILVDELERGLHPRAVADLVSNLRKVLEENPGQQIVATTHSPFVLNSLEPTEVWLTAGDDSGSSVLRRLADHPRATRLSQILKTGELWSALGEEWATTESQSDQVKP